ncbi:MAG: S26 family signal peptidase [Mesorhizobium sp.]|uniref:S26 family signal peptidase n=1 Tax=Mesorhizobium sp. TaxID=1871066 RepID=UPI000FE64B3B|nr:S26 family signal peptidase [Mesorhizobium sp.]RWB28252.1 MAG: S26 family signal peptidase [Mesorhizobium sp.]RWB44952.1 MAG: S26 family signal peptidase [Mesorhizobium sp.]RWF68059.1 MAG: S26 family signal peptidase [Mesorhizobium sp.]TIS62669.1 MAG: S26 family signal peptidase [Mesorhizobium sp.]
MKPSRYVVATCFAVLATGGLSSIHIAPKLVWNASASTPIGLYRISPAGRLAVGDLVAVDAPEQLASFLADNGYLPPGVPLMKRVAGLPGQEVCRNGLAITVDGIEIGKALEHDHLGRPLPVWQACRRIVSGEVFLMNAQVHDSLDGRYFGPIATSLIIGRATPLWTEQGGTAGYEWRAPSH